MKFFSILLVLLSIAWAESPEMTAARQVNLIQKTTETATTAHNCDESLLRPYEVSEPIDQSQPTLPEFCGTYADRSELKKYSSDIHYDLETEVSIGIGYHEKQGSKTVSAYTVYANKYGPGHPHLEKGKLSDSKPTIHPQRSYSYKFDGRGKENVFEVLDLPVRSSTKGKGIKDTFLSTTGRMKLYTFFPRKMVPSIRKTDDEIHMTLTTGEEVVLDLATGKVKSGAAKEVPSKNVIEKRPGDERYFPETNFEYSGNGLFIESALSASKDDRDAGNTVSAKAIVGGVLQECRLKSEDLWIHSSEAKGTCTRLKFEKDEDLYKMVREKCPGFKFPALVP